MPENGLGGLGIDLGVGIDNSKVVWVDSILGQNIVDQGTSNGDTDDATHAPEERHKGGDRGDVSL